MRVSELMNKHGLAQPGIEMEVQVAVTFHDRTGGIESRTGPIIVFHTDRQVVLLIEVDNAAVKGDLLAGRIGMDRLDTQAAAAVGLVFLDPNLRPVQPAFQLPGLAKAIDQVADARFGNRMPAGFEGPWVPGIHRHEADYPPQAR